MMNSFWLIEDVARRGRLFHYHMMGTLSTVAFERHGADMAMIAPDSVELDGNQRMDSLLSHVSGNRLTYKDLIRE